MQLVKSQKSERIFYAFGAPFGIEYICAGNWGVFREFGKNRFYIRDTTFRSKEQAISFLEEIVEKYNSSIITALN